MRNMTCTVPVRDMKYKSMYVCMYGMYVLYVCMYVCRYVCMVCVYCMYVCMHLFILGSLKLLHINMHIRILAIY